MKRHDEFLWNLPGAAKAHRAFMYDIEGIDIDKIVSTAVDEENLDEDSQKIGGLDGTWESATNKSSLSTDGLTTVNQPVCININFGNQNFNFGGKDTEKKSLGAMLFDACFKAALFSVPGWAKTILTRLIEKF